MGDMCMETFLFVAGMVLLIVAILASFRKKKTDFDDPWPNQGYHSPWDGGCQRDHDELPRRVIESFKKDAEESKRVSQAKDSSTILKAMQKHVAETRDNPLLPVDMVWCQDTESFKPIGILPE